MNTELKEHQVKNRIKQIKKSKADRRKLNSLKNSLSVDFTNTTILHWQAGMELADVSHKVQPTEKQKRYRRL